MEYLDFDMAIEAGEANCVARVVASPFGRASSTFALPFSDQDLENFVLKIGRTRAGIRKIDSPQMSTAREWGRHLYDAVFAGDVGRIFQRSLDEAERETKGLRLRLSVGEASPLYEVPWEFLYSNDLGRFLAISVSTPIVRFIDIPQKIRRLAVAPPLRVLVVVPSPADVVRLDVQGEMARLADATAQLRADGRLEMDALENATFDMLRKRLNQARTRGTPIHVLHFVGHGTFEGESGQGALLFETEHRGSRPVSGHDLGMILHDHSTLRLAILNACEGARASREEPLGGVAQSLVRQGIPAVIAMQFEVTDKTAKVFAEEFYVALCEGQPIDAASAEARRAVFTSDNDVEWATPVVYLRTPDGAIFDIDPAAAVDHPDRRLPSPPAPAPAVEPAHPAAGCEEFVVGKPVADPRCFFGRYHEVKRLLQKVRVAPLQNAAIVGPKRSGKTSLLRHLRDISEAPLEDLRPRQRGYAREGFEAHRWVYADFQDPLLRTRSGLLSHLVGGVVERPDRGDLDLGTFFRLMTDHLDRPTVFLLDEVGVALQRHTEEFDDTFWDAMRSLASSDPGRNLAFVLATHQPPYEIATMNDYASPFFNIIGYTATLGPLAENDARELVAGSPVPFPEADVEWIVEQSAGWPILLQILCSERLDSLREGDLTDTWRGTAVAQLDHHRHLLAGQSQ